MGQAGFHTKEAALNKTVAALREIIFYLREADDKTKEVINLDDFK